MATTGYTSDAQLAAFKKQNLVTLGYERKGGVVQSTGKSFRAYCKGGRPGLWLANLYAPPRRGLVVCESPFDCIARAKLIASSGCDPDEWGYIALRSGAEAHAVTAIEKAVNNLETKIVFICTDNDAAGMSYAQKLMAGISEQKIDVSVRYVAPPLLAKDWNDALIAKTKRETAGEKSPAEYRPEADWARL